MSEKLLTLKRSFRPRHKQPHRIYGLLRIHKADVPLRPIVSCVNTFAYDLFAYLANILSPLTGKSEYTVTNSAHFVSTVSNETILDNEIMVSFDVELLFTTVPIEAAVQAALQNFEEQAITTLSYDPRIWKRYVDNTFTILDRENVNDFLQHLNNQQPSIRFTMETEKDNKLAFLDTAVLREPDGHLTTSIYRKPTHTDQYLAYDSHHPQSVKRGIIKCLHERAKRLVTKPSVISKEKKHLSSVLVSNAYPFSFSQKLTKTGKPNNSA